MKQSTNRLLHFFLKLNIAQAVITIVLLSIPLYLWIYHAPAGYQRAIQAAIVGVIYFLLSFSLYLFVIIIRQLNATSLRRKIVIFTRIFIRFHIAFALLGLLFILYHVYFFLPVNHSFVHLSGLLALMTILPLFLTGYLRKRKATGKRKLTHRYAGYLCIASILLHIIL